MNVTRAAGLRDFLTMVGSELVPHQQVSTADGKLMEKPQLVWYLYWFFYSSADPLPFFDSLR